MGGRKAGNPGRDTAARESGLCSPQPAEPWSWMAPLASDPWTSSSSQWTVMPSWTRALPRRGEVQEGGSARGHRGLGGHGVETVLAAWVTWVRLRRALKATPGVWT